MYFQTLSECRKYLWWRIFRRPLTISHGPSTSIVAWIVRNYIAERCPTVQGGKIDAQQPAAFVARSHVSLFISAGTSGAGTITCYWSENDTSPSGHAVVLRSCFQRVSITARPSNIKRLLSRFWKDSKL